MKYNDPSEFFKFIIENADIEVINDNQKCLALALDLLDSEKNYFNLLKISLQYNAYKELIKSYNSDSSAKSISINRANKILHEKCFIEKDKAIWAVGWLASLIYPTEWKAFLNQLSSNNEDNKEIIWEQPNSKPVITVEESNNSKNNIFEGKNWTLEDINLEMIYCPAGSFMMGSPEPVKDKANYNGLFTEDIVNGELGRCENELQHQVIISKPFLIGKYPITQKQYFAVMGEKPSEFIGENNPVEYVSWNDAKKFCERLNNLFKDKIPVGCRFSLPTEAQWEYACRAGTTTSLNSGKNITSKEGSCYNLDEVGWYLNNSNNTTHEVGQKKPNAWGIYDMHGNIWEWCKDWYGVYIFSSVIDPTGPTSGSGRVIRGGSWSNDAVYCRSANRCANRPVNRYRDLGFRLALVTID